MLYRALIPTMLCIPLCSCGGSQGTSQGGSEAQSTGSEGEWTVSDGRSVVTLEEGGGGAAQPGASNEQVDVHFGNLVVNGGHVGATVKKSLIRERFRFEPCYLDSEAGKQGRRVVLSIDMFVHRDGHVSEPKVSGSEEEMAECVADVLSESNAMPNGGERSRVLFRVLLQPPSATGSDTSELEEPF